MLPFHKLLLEMWKGLVKMKGRKNNPADQGSAYEGRDQAFVDVDRMINEGLSGGSVHSRYESTNIEEARELPEEQPPYECD